MAWGLRHMMCGRNVSPKSRRDRLAQGLFIPASEAHKARCSRYPARLDQCSVCTCWVLMLHGGGATRQKCKVRSHVSGVRGCKVHSTFRADLTGLPRHSPAKSCVKHWSVSSSKEAFFPCTAVDGCCRHQADSTYGIAIMYMQGKEDQSTPPNYAEAQPVAQVVSLTSLGT